MTGSRVPPRWLRQPWAQVAVLVALCLLLFGYRLGSGGFIDTEGHRVVPAYEMLETGQYLVPHMFERPYVRKPPGMPWAVSAFTSVLGESVWSARLVSAGAMTLGVLVSWWFGRIWFGAWGGLAAGLAHALMPQLWQVARHAEIESLNQLGTQMTALALVHLMATRGRRAWVAVVIGCLGTIVMLFAKGPAGAAVPGAVIVGACLARRSIRPVLCTRVALVLIPGFGLFAWWALAARAWLAGYTGAVDPALQSPGAFMWAGPIWEIGAFPIAAWVSALPGSLALLFPWGPDARAEGRRGERGWRSPYRVAITLGLAWALAVALWWALGIGNPRYAMPASVLIPPLAGYVAWGLATGRFLPKRRAIAQGLGLGWAWVWPAIVTAGWVGYIHLAEADRRATSGREAGEALGAAIVQSLDAGMLPAGEVTLVADGVVEARPEILLSAERTVAAAGRGSLRVLWGPVHGPNGYPDLGDLLALRDDDLGSEFAESDVDNRWATGQVLAEVTAHKYRVKLILRRPFAVSD